MSEQQHIVPLRLNLTIYAILMGLLLATIAAAYVPLGRFHFAAAMAIAAVKAALILLFFMHVKYSHRLTWVFAGASFVWLTILIVLSMADYHSRGWLDIPGK